MKAVILLYIIAVTSMVAEARSPLGIVYPFPIDTVLRCRIPHPTQPGTIIDAPTPTIPLVPGEPGTVWLPEEIQFRPPPGRLDAPWLVPLLPDGIPEGLLFLHCPRDGDEIPPVMIPTASGMRPPIPPLVEGSLTGFNASEQNTIRRFWGRVGFPACDEPIYNVTKLPDYYFPPCYAGGRCSGAGCSLPEGQNCHATTRNTFRVRVFRWDCCWDYDRAVWRWACGWYVVYIQIVTECFCSCRPVLT